MPPTTIFRQIPLPTGTDLSGIVGAVGELQTQLRHDLPLALYRSVSTPAQIVANQNDYAIGSARVNRLSTDASRTISGFRNAGPGGNNVPNAELTVINVGSFNIVFSHQDTNSVAANRFLMDSAANVTLLPNDSITFYYDQATARWRNYAGPVSALTGNITYAQLPTGSGTWTVSGTLGINATAVNVTGNGTISGTFSVAGATTISGAMTVTGNAVFAATISVGGAQTISGNLTVTGTATFGTYTGQSGIVTVGALANGSIVAGFGNINNASNSLTTGALTASSATITGAFKTGGGSGTIVLDYDQGGIQPKLMRNTGTGGLTVTGVGGDGGLNVTGAMTGTTATFTATSVGQQVNVVGGGSQAGFGFTTTSRTGFLDIDDANNYYRFGINGNIRMFLTSAGALTIGTTAGTGSGAVFMGALTATTAKLTPGAFAAGDKYLIIDASGNVHVSALGPAS